MLIGMVTILTFTSLASASQITWLVEAGVSTPITKTIRHLQPALSWEEANKHAWEIYDQAERTGVDWKIIVAVTFQESSFKFMRGDKTCGLTPSGEEACVYRAFGPMHVYWEYWKDKLKINAKKFVSDISYQYTIGVDILKSRLSEYGDVGTYNSLTEKYKERYRDRIDQHLANISSFLAKLLENSDG